MLIQFNVSNFRSYHQPQTFSMVAAKDSSHQKTNCIESGITALPNLLRSAVLYGPNAGGKSNLIAALSIMRNIVETSATSIREGAPLNVMPFRFDQNSNKQPTEFEIIFIEEGVRYQYGFALTSKRIVHEWLLVYVGRKAQRWFERIYDSKKDKDQWYFGSHFLGGNQRQTWKKSTRANALFLSTAVNLNSEQLRSIFNWFVNKLVILRGNAPNTLELTIQRVLQDSEKPKILKFLQAADLGITDVKIVMRKAKQLDIRLETGKLPEQIISETEYADITLFHRAKSNNKDIGFNFYTEESQGTKRLFAYAGPFLDVLQHGRVLVVDELDNSLHSKIVHFLINLLHNSELNQKNAQLIFSTHNTSLLDTNLFRRDQVWFIEKDEEQASKLFPLTDFHPRKDEALEKGYLIGRYGALPFLGDFKF